MSWVKLDDQFFVHRKVVNLSKDAKLLHLAAINHTCAQRSDGFMARATLRMLAAMVDVKPSVSRELEEAGLWERAADGGYRLLPSDLWKRYLPDDHPVRIEWVALRLELTPQILERDGAICAYCGSTENLTIDHIIPVSRGGTNHLYNLTPACRSCNSSKGDKLIKEWER